MEDEILAKIQKHLDNLYEGQDKIMKFIKEGESLTASKIDEIKKEQSRLSEFVDWYGSELRRLKGMQSASFLEELKKKFPDLG